MTIKIGINGFGRIGRNVLRSAIENFTDLTLLPLNNLPPTEDSTALPVAAVNALLDPDYLAYMLQYASVHGRFRGTVSVEGSHLIVNGNKIRLTQERDPAQLRWSEVGAEVVIESTGLF